MKRVFPIISQEGCMAIGIVPHSFIGGFIPYHAVGPEGSELLSNQVEVLKHHAEITLAPGVRYRICCPMTEDDPIAGPPDDNAQWLIWMVRVADSMNERWTPSATSYIDMETGMLVYHRGEVPDPRDVPHPADE